jgi:hypothetical protein
MLIARVGTAVVVEVGVDLVAEEVEVAVERDVTGVERG